MKKYKVIGYFMLILTLFVSLFPNQSYAQSKSEQIKINRQSIVFSVDGKHYASPAHQQSFIYQKRTYVSIRFASYMLEKWIDWDEKTETVVITKPTDEQKKQLKELKLSTLVKDSKVTEKSIPEIKNVNVRTNYGAIIVDDELKTLPSDVTTILLDKTLFVPLRYFGELFENEVDFDTDTYTVVLNSAAYLKQHKNSNEQLGENLVAENPGGFVPGAPVAGGSTPGKIATKEELVNQTTSQLSMLKQNLIATSNEMLTKYSEETDTTKKNLLMNEGLDRLAEVDKEIEAIISQLEKEASGYKINLKNEADRMRAEYSKQRQDMIDQMMKNLK